MLMIFSVMENLIISLLKNRGNNIKNHKIQNLINYFTLSEPTLLTWVILMNFPTCHFLMETYLQKEKKIIISFEQKAFHKLEN
jgi:hypothetical protein